MIVAKYADVEPRAFRQVDLIEILTANSRTIRLLGQGKSVALKHLAKHFANEKRFVFLDGDSQAGRRDFDVAVFASRNQFRADVDLRFAINDLDSRRPN